MWQSWLNLKTYHRRASDDLEIEDGIAAWCVDGAVMWFGITMENALAERNEVTVNGRKEYRPKYSLAQLLEPTFKLPKPQREIVRKPQAPSGFAALLAMAKQGPSSGIKLWEYVKPS